MANNKNWAADEGDDGGEQLPANQLSHVDDHDVNNVIQDMLNNVQSQDIFSNTPPKANNQQKKKKRASSNSKVGGMLPKQKPDKQKIFQPINNDKPEEDDNGDKKIGAAMVHNAHHLHSAGEGSSSFSSSSSMPSTSANDSTDREVEHNDTTTNKNDNDMDQVKARSTIQCFMRQLINPNETNNPSNQKLEQILDELSQYYLRQMIYRDKAARNLNNINFAKERNGRVPVGMQIKVTPEVLGNSDVNFKQAWALAIQEAEETLSVCIEQHLTNYIQRIDSNISARVNEVLDTLIGAQITDPIQMIKSNLTKANTERNRINEEARKRKRENKDNHKEGPPNKKAKK